MKGIARLATIINSPQALRATDLIIDVFVEVWTQVARGTNEIELSNPSRLIPAKGQDAKVLRDFRRKLIKALDGLLDTVVNPRTQATVRDELEDTALTALDHVKERLKTRGLENDRLAAETMLILEQVRDLREKREAMLKRSHARTETIALENLDKKIEIKKALFRSSPSCDEDAMSSMFDGPSTLPSGDVNMPSDASTAIVMARSFGSDSLLSSAAASEEKSRAWAKSVDNRSARFAALWSAAVAVLKRTTVSLVIVPPGEFRFVNHRLRYATLCAHADNFAVILPS